MDGVREQIFNLFEIYPDEIMAVSAKMGVGVTQLLDSIVERYDIDE